VRDALALVAFKGKSFRLPAAAELLSLCVLKEKVTKEKGTPLPRFPGLLPGKFAVGLRGLSTGHPALTPNWFASMRTTLRAFLRPPAAAEGPRVEQRAILARTFQNGQIKSSAAANLGSALAPALVFAFPLYHRVRATMARCSPGAPVRR
jgi:hypothetical protein